MAFKKISALILGGIILYIVVEINYFSKDESDQPQAVPAEVNSNEPTHSLDEVLAIAQKILDNLRANVRDYQALMVKRERISGQLGDEVRIELKVRNRQSSQSTPQGSQSSQSSQDDSEVSGLAAYLKFVSPPSVAGREVIWVEGQNDNKLIAHESGYANLMSMNLAPDGLLAMLGNKYPITEIGLVRLVEKLIEKGQRDRNLAQTTVSILEDQLVGERKCTLIQVTHPQASPGLDFHIAQIYFDPEQMVPLRYAAFMWPSNPGEAPPLEEEYTYLNLALNVGLTDSDFDPKNSQYNYP